MMIHFTRFALVYLCIVGAVYIIFVCLHPLVRKFCMILFNLYKSILAKNVNNEKWIKQNQMFNLLNVSESINTPWSHVIFIDWMINW